MYIRSKIVSLSRLAKAKSRFPISRIQNPYRVESRVNAPISQFLKNPSPSWLYRRFIEAGIFFLYRSLFKEFRKFVGTRDVSVEQRIKILIGRYKDDEVDRIFLFRDRSSRSTSKLSESYRDRRLRPRRRDQGRCPKLRDRRDCHCHLVQNLPRRPGRPSTSRPGKCCRSNWPTSFACRVALSGNQTGQTRIITRHCGSIDGNQDYPVYPPGH